MKHLLRFKNLSLLLLIAMCSYSINGYADKQGKKKAKVVKQQMIKEDYGKTVTLVTSGSGVNEDEATRNALRSAIEQAFGTFVSSNTKVVNDELVSDAIATISSGNVLGYEQISCVDTQDGCQVSVKAVVSIGGLVSFAQNKGMETDLAGNTFLLNRNLAILNKKNEMVALNNLAEQLFTLRNQLYDFSVEVGQPYDFSEYVGHPLGSGPFAVDVSVTASPNSNMNNFWDIIDKTLSSLSMSPQESNNYRSLGMKTYEYCYGPSFERFKIEDEPNLVGIKSRYILRTNIGRVAYGGVLTDKNTEFFLLQIIESIEKMGKYCYEIYDNIGTVITPTIEEGTDKGERKIDGFKYGPLGNENNEKYYAIMMNSTGVQEGARYNKVLKPRVDFRLLYNESQLSKLKKISVRPHGIKFTNK